MKRLGLIISAGKQTRFDNETPKALMPMDGSTLLDLNIEHLRAYCDDVKVVTSFENNHTFDDYDTIAIRSGLGCGDAVQSALLYTKDEDGNYPDEVIIQWGDSYIDPYVLSRLCDVEGKFIIPVYWEEKPYVRITENSAQFSKYGEVNEPGFHDVSIFRVNTAELLERCAEFGKKYFDLKACKYNHLHGNEFTFLDLINEGFKPTLVEVPEGQCFSFNTVEEYKECFSD